MSEVPPDGPEFPPGGLGAHLDPRLRDLPVHRIRSPADYYALRRIEAGHIKSVGPKFSLSGADSVLTERWWQERVRYRLADRLKVISEGQRKQMLRWMTKTKHSHLRPIPRQTSKLVCLAKAAISQVAFNTIGPGGCSWLDNRYVAVRCYTFRLYWRP